MGRPEQKNESWMPDLAWKPRRYAGAVMDCSPGGNSTDRSCTLLHHHGKFVDLDLESDLVSSVKADTAENSFFLVLKPRSSNIGSSEVKPRQRSTKARRLQFGLERHPLHVKFRVGRIPGKY